MTTGGNNNEPLYPRSVRILTGAPMMLVKKRESRTSYQTNNEIKYWSTWFLLKALTTTGYIQRWTCQKPYILEWLQMGKGTFRSHLRWLQSKKLLSIDRPSHSIRLVKYSHAAKIMGIDFAGTYEVSYDQNKQHGKQAFRYVLVMEEFKESQKKQLSGLFKKMDANPSLKQTLILLLEKEGCDSERVVSDREYFAERLLQLQIRAFREGSELLSLIFSVRADLNRGVKKIREHHGYRSQQSVSYLKRCMFSSGVIAVEKIAVVSTDRSRIYVPSDKDQTIVRDGHKWLPGKKQTALFFCDQVTANY